MTRDTSLDIAVTGLSARLPGSSNLDEWWSAVLSGKVLTTRYERSALLDAGVPTSLLDDPDYVPVRGHLNQADRFDAALFRISPRDAELMDPQHRLMLESVWSALEDAGIAPTGGMPTTGVYASATGSEYLRSMVAGGGLDPVSLEEALHGTEPDFMAGRIAYKLGLTGPAMAVQTACSSALVGVHLAVQALWNGDCEQAVVVAAGMGYPQAGHLFMRGGIYSAAGTCRPFDESADGTVAGSGVASVVLRRLTDIDDDDPEPYGVILGTAVNNDAAARAGYYAPSPVGQEAVIRSALRAAEVDADGIGYLETHGTATRLGDNIEWSAASAALAASGARAGQVAVGAAKANIGHLDSAAGLVGLIKALLTVKSGLIPPVAGFTKLNSLLEDDTSPLFVPTEAMPWTGAEPRRAGVSSFGIGGTNAHVVIEQAPRRTTARPVSPDAPQLVTLSAADADALSRAAVRLRGYLTDNEPPLADVSRTLVSGRATLPERLAVAGRTGAEIAHRLDTGIGTVRGRGPDNGPAPVVFLFPGQGSQYPGMAVPFADTLPGFTAALKRCLGAFDPPLADRLRGALFSTDFPPAQLMETRLAQPAIFAVEYAAFTALTALGITPAALVGHSLGDVAAACVAGVLDLPGAARFVAARGRAMAACPVGAMLAVRCGEGRALELIAESGSGLELAAVNTPDNCVLAGDPEAVETFRRWLGNRVDSQLLRTSHAFHSALIEPALPELATELARTRLGRPTVPLTDAAGRVIPVGARIDPDSFVRQARVPVRFADAMGTVSAHFPGAVVVEVGPGRALSAMAEAVGLSSVPLSPGKAASDGTELLTALGTLWTLGQPVDVERLCGEGRRIHLPGYAFAGPSWLAPEAAGRTRPYVEPPRAAAAPIPGDDRFGEDTSGQAAAAVLTSIWAELLGQPDLKAESDFFELGGDSLTITRLARRVHKDLGVHVPIRAMLAARTLEKQIAVVLGLLGVTETS
ncbi:beta-ketoacyl synthase N-terminal-like domain-containing protein [Streptomyces sp. NPDC094034]|uniref:type I polyketide synthase n=1 Tax=Streptomyces sp. NPDC094034 TaxID=3155309 RepID=UPI00332DDED0